MAPSDDDGVDSVNYAPSTGLQGSKLLGKNSQVKYNICTSSSQSIKDTLDAEKTYDEVATFDDNNLETLEEGICQNQNKSDIIQAYDEVAALEENDLRNLLEEVTSQKQSKNAKSAIAQFLISKEEDALREESGSGEDTIDLGFCRHKKKRPNCRRDQCSGVNNSAASRNNTGGSLGSLHNISDTKVPEKKTSTNNQGVASRSIAGGSCGNLSKGSFPTDSCKRRNRRSKEVARASASQREGGSLQNLNKETSTTNDAKKLHKSESLSQVFTDVGGVRVKSRRQKTTSESSSCRLHSRRSEDKEPDDSSEGETTEYPYQPLISTSGITANDVPDGIVIGSGVTRWNNDHMPEEDEEMHISACSTLRNPRNSSYGRNDSTELLTVVNYSDRDNDVDKPVQFSLCKSQCLDNKPQGLLNGRTLLLVSVENAMTTTTSSAVFSYTTPCVTSIIEGKSMIKDEDGNEKRKLRSTKSDSGSFEKSSLDENGNPVLTSVRSSTLSSNAATISILGRRNGFAPPKEVSVYDRLKAKQDKKKANKEKDVISVEKVPGFCGAEPLDNILKFLGAEDTSIGKSKRKKTGKKEDEAARKKAKDKSEEECVDDDKKKKLKKKKSSGILRESSSMEDLVSKCKQNDSGVLCKQRTVDDGNLRSSPYRSKADELIDEDWSNVEKIIESEFTYDFYKVGDTTLDAETLLEAGDFEVVNRKKGKKSKGLLKHNNDRKPRGSSSHQINFSEAPRTLHEGTFLSQWSGSRGGTGFSATTSAPHSEDSDSDGGDSVHSMPAHAITPKPQVRKPPPSTDSTPQTSYANIAKLASKTPQHKNTMVDDEDVDLHDLKNESSILDDHFPPLSSSSGISSGPNSSMSDIVSPPSGEVTRKFKVTPSFDIVSLPSNECVKKSKLLSTNIDIGSCPLSEISKKAKMSQTDNISPPASEFSKKSKQVLALVDYISPPSSEITKRSKILPSPIDVPTASSLELLKKSKTSPLPMDVCSPPPMELSRKIKSSSPFDIITQPMIEISKNTKMFPSATGSNDKWTSPNSQRPASCTIEKPLVPPLKLTSVVQLESAFMTSSDSAKENNNCISTSNCEKSVNRDLKQSKTRKCSNITTNLIVENGIRVHKSEPAVVFTDNARFHHSITGIEFGFDVSLETLPENNNQCLTLSKSENEIVYCNHTDNNNLKNLNKKDYSKLYKAPKNDIISYNYDELRKHMSKAWESTLRMMEEDPKNIQYWQATGPDKKI